MKIETKLKGNVVVEREREVLIAVMRSDTPPSFSKGDVEASLSRSLSLPSLSLCIYIHTQCTHIHKKEPCFVFGAARVRKKESSVSLTKSDPSLIIFYLLLTIFMFRVKIFVKLQSDSVKLGFLKLIVSELFSHLVGLANVCMYI